MTVLLNGLVGFTPTHAQRSGNVTVDTSLVRDQLAALLRATSVSGRSPNEIHVERAMLQLHPGATVYTGMVSGDGPHGGDATAVVAATSSGMILPVGCPQTRLVLQASNPPTFTDSTLPQYAAIVAMLDGRIPYGEIPSDWRLILDPKDVPAWAQQQASERRLSLVPARVEEFGKPVLLRRRVSVMVLGGDTLYLVIVNVAAAGRFLDIVEDVVELASRRVG
jgi:hypothetical protein